MIEGAGMKKLINAPETVVDDALRGIAVAEPQLRVDLENRVIFRAEPTRAGKVALISGGGAGHEPLHGGYVGHGMLDAAVTGAVFTSPTPMPIVAALAGADSGAGVIQIVKNYTGDVMNFEMAGELAAAGEGLKVETVLVADDVAVEDSTFTTGRRGVGLAVLMEKLLGAAAEADGSMEYLLDLAARINAGGRSMGMALTSCTVPEAGRPTFDLPHDQMEIGIGVHGEPGRRQEPLADASHVAQQLVAPILADHDYTGKECIVLLNGMGATPLLELYLVYGEVVRLLEAEGITVVRNLVGNYITSLDMAGCSVTLLEVDAELVALWDAPVSTPALRWGM